jgi:Rad3-related DNA helicase
MSKNWSLYKEKKDKPGEADFLEPMTFSNGKTQGQVVKETVDAIKGGAKVVFIRGGCGTGKSAIALNIAKELGKASIVVPIKSLQKQYENDYTKRKYVMGKDGKRLKIKVITGRQNHHCPYMDCQADEKELPCTIELKKKNWDKLMEYIEQNPFVDPKSFEKVTDVRRMSVAMVCPDWSPIMPGTREIELLKDSKKIKYEGLKGVKYTIYKRGDKCSYCNQFDCYENADVLVFNGKKYILETFLNRKPATDVEIIDECDEFLDSFSNEKKFSLSYLKSSLENLPGDKRWRFNRFERILDEILGQEQTSTLAQTEEVFKLTGLMKDLFVEMLGLDIYDLVDEDNYLFRFYEIARMFEHFLDESYFGYYDNNGRISVRIVTLSLAKIFQEMLDRNKSFVFMSGTIHSEKILKEIFAFKNYKIIDAEIKMPGKVLKKLHGNELNCSYASMKGGGSREKYLKALSKCMDVAERPVLIQVTSFYDLPSKIEAEKYNILNLMTREKLLELQTKDKTGEIVKRFRGHALNVLFTTKCNRGIDFPGNSCNSIILTKYPYPDASSIFWKVLKKEKPKIFNEFYMDKSRREFLQRIYRGVRFKEDKVTILSPDVRVFWNIASVS